MHKKTDHPQPTYEQLAVGRVLRRHGLHDQARRLREPLRALHKALRQGKRVRWAVEWHGNRGSAVLGLGQPTSQ